MSSRKTKMPVPIAVLTALLIVSASSGGGPSDRY